MSISVFLVQFIPNDDGNICEDSSVTIEESTITDELLRKLEEKFEVQSTSVCEFFGSKETSIYEIFDNNELDEILDFLKDQFVSLVNEAHGDLNAPVIKKRVVEQYSYEMFALLNITRLFELKLENFADMDNVKLKISR